MNKQMGKAMIQKNIPHSTVRNNEELDLLGLHCFLCEFLNLPHCSWGSIFKSNVVETLAHMNCVVAGDDIGRRLLSFSGFLYHLDPLTWCNGLGLITNLAPHNYLQPQICLFCC